MVRQNYINHVGLVLDASSSMNHLTASTIKVADLQIQYLAQRSKEMDQETRATVYTFNTEVDCVYYDRDVLRLPSIKDDYRPKGMTALVDAVIQAIMDLKQTATLYGDHAFLLYVLTDGMENASKQSARSLTNILGMMPDNWTIAVFVPDSSGVFEAKKLGFAPGNITVWNTTNQGLIEVGKTIQRTTDAYMTSRSQGIRGTKGLFNLDTAYLTPHNVHENLIPVPRDRYKLGYVPATMQIADYVQERLGITYKKGNSFYQLTKPETVQDTKQVIVRDKQTGDVFSGTAARGLLSLPGYDVRVAPVDHPKYDIFIQSTSVNRKLVPGTEVITVV